MSAWLVYRDVGVWSAEADDMIGALDRAQWGYRRRTDAEIMAGVAASSYVPVGVSWSPDTPPPIDPAADALPLTIETRAGIFGERDRFDAIYSLGPSVLLVESHSTQSYGRAGLALVLRSLEAAALREQAASMVRPRYFASYSSGKRSGQPKFSRKDSPERRKQMQAAYDFNNERKRMLDVQRWCVGRLLSVLPRLSADCDALTIEVVDGLHSQTSRACAWDDVTDPDALSKWLSVARGLAEGRLRAAASVELHGFGQGERVDVIASEYSAAEQGDDLKGPAVVVQVCTGVDQHERLVRFPDGSEEWFWVTRLALPT